MVITPDVYPGAGTGRTDATIGIICGAQVDHSEGGGSTISFFSGPPSDWPHQGVPQVGNLGEVGEVMVQRHDGSVAGYPPLHTSLMHTSQAHTWGHMGERREG